MDKTDPRYFFAELSMRRMFAFFGSRCESAINGFKDCAVECSQSPSSQEECFMKKCVPRSDAMNNCMLSEQKELEDKPKPDYLLRNECGRDFQNPRDFEEEVPANRVLACNQAIQNYWSEVLSPSEYPETETSEFLLNLALQQAQMQAQRPPPSSGPSGW